MSSSLNILRRYQYDPLDRLSGANPSEGIGTRRFYQGDHLVTELEEHSQRTIVRHEAQPLAQHQSAAGVTETTLLATDQAYSLLRTVEQQVAYTAYGHHPAESGLSRLIGFNGECPDTVTGHYLLGQGTRAFNPVLMRFNSPDELSPFGEGGINSYAYCGGDPINFSDPSGELRVVQAFKPWNFPSPLKPIKPTSTTINRAPKASRPAPRASVTASNNPSPVSVNAGASQPRSSTSTRSSAAQLQGQHSNTSLSLATNRPAAISDIPSTPALMSFVPENQPGRSVMEDFGTFYDSYRRSGSMPAPSQDLLRALRDNLGPQINQAIAINLLQLKRRRLAAYLTTIRNNLPNNQ